MDLYFCFIFKIVDNFETQLMICFNYKLISCFCVEKGLRIELKIKSLIEFHFPRVNSSLIEAQNAHNF